MAGQSAIIYKTAEEIEIIRQNGDILGRAHGEVAKLIAPGVTTAQLEKVAFEFINDNNAKASFKGYPGKTPFPSALCVSLNEVVVHGMPSKNILKEGDILSVDCGVYKNGFHADSAYTYPIGEVNEKVAKLLETTLQSLWLGLEQCKPGNRMGDMSSAIQTHCEAAGFSVVREMIGHGVGRNLHEAPEVPNYGKRGKGIAFLPGLVMAVEPMINAGSRRIVMERDGWTIRTVDKQPSAHFEHTIAITQTGHEVLTTFAYIEEVLKQKYGETSVN